MTNEPSGSKRPWEGTNGADSHKRPREDPSAKDWRDVHLKASASSKRSPVDRRREERRPRSRDHDHHRRPSDYGRDRRDDRDRDRRHDRDRERDRYRESSRREDAKGEDGRSDDGRSATTPISRSTSVLTGAANGTPQPPDDSEREEGE